MRTSSAALLAAALLLSPLTVAPAHAVWDTVITNEHPADDERILPGDVTFTFTTNEGGTTGFQCQLNDAGAWVACNGGTITYQDLPPGAYVFRVKGTVMGTEDTTPAQRVFVVRNVPCEQAGTAWTEARDRFVKYKTKKGYKKEALQRARAAGQEKKVERLEKRIKVLTKRIRRAARDMAAAQAQQDAVC